MASRSGGSDGRRPWTGRARESTQSPQSTQRFSTHELSDRVMRTPPSSIRRQLRARVFDQFSTFRSVKREKSLVLAVTSTSLRTWAIAAICPSTYRAGRPSVQSRSFVTVPRRRRGIVELRQPSAGFITFGNIPAMVIAHSKLTAQGDLGAGQSSPEAWHRPGLGPGMGRRRRAGRGASGRPVSVGGIAPIAVPDASQAQNAGGDEGGRGAARGTGAATMDLR